MSIENLMKLESSERVLLYILLPFATPCLCKTRFSAVEATKAKYQSMMNLKNYLRVVISNSNLGISRVQRSNHICPTNPVMKHVFILVD
jgi:hypothetical protein